MEVKGMVGQAKADMRAGFRTSMEDLAIATLVTLPFTGTAGILLNVIAGWPSAVTLALTALVQVFATLWNAGWRARTGF